jgi:hypothetical protein
VTAAALLLVLTIGPGPRARPPSAQARDSFPHAAHRRLFTACTTCHAGIPAGDTATARPPTSFCGTCHDGRDQRLVDWVPRPARASNLRYDHRAHIAAVLAKGDEALVCTRCHASGDSTGALMEVARARPERCITCHAHQADTHLAEASSCRTCHRVLTEARGLPTARISGFPRPASHDSAFLFTHGDAAATSSTCAVCHARDFCAACHVNASRVAAIQALDADPRVAEVARSRPVVYRAPASHAAPGFNRGHAPASAQAIEQCASCHTRESCVACHGPDARASAIAAMPPRAPSGALGVSLAAARPAGHGARFALDHRAAAAAGDQSCLSCHTQRYCATCHDGTSRPAFHAVNFVMRHGSPAYTQENECAACHQTQVFCRDCHRRIGRGTDAAPSGSYHTSQPNWRFGHAAAARRSIETCASCHAQSFCLSCHSARQGQGVSPHGPGFNPAMGDKNPAMCRICHATVPTH